MTANRALIVGGVVLALLSTIFIFSNPLSIAGSGEFVFSQGSSYNGQPDPDLVSGDFRLSTNPPSVSCTDRQGNPVNPSTATITPSIRLTCSPDQQMLTVTLNGVSYVLQKDIPQQVDEFTTLTYESSGISSNNAEGVPTYWSNSVRVFINNSFLEATTPVDEPTQIGFRQPFVGTSIITNNYVRLEGRVSVMYTNELLSIVRRVDTIPMFYEVGENTLGIDLLTEDLLGQEVKVIPIATFFIGDRQALSVRGTVGEKFYDILPVGATRPTIQGNNVLIVPQQRKNIFMRLIDKLFAFFGGNN